ncbi:MAG: AP2 domain-containing protein [Clostridiales bacterium]|nr:AP2 domain-containing protein [Clostridiales bacterium]
MAQGVWLQAGDTYGKLTLLSCEYRPGKSGKRTRKFWNCRCSCGNEFQISGQNVLRYQDRGCPDCREKAKRHAIEESARSHIGEQVGSLTITDFAGFYPAKGQKGVHPFMWCKCSQCGSETEVALSKLINNHVKECRACQGKHLQTGHDLLKEAAVGGSSAVHCSPNRKRNKNNTTGVKGVSFNARSGKYRAYINFQRKQYHLGEYVKLEDAAAARKTAEEEIHGRFLEWYAAEFPGAWAKIQKSKK